MAIPHHCEEWGESIVGGPCSEYDRADVQGRGVGDSATRGFGGGLVDRPCQSDWRGAIGSQNRQWIGRGRIQVGVSLGVLKRGSRRAVAAVASWRANRRQDDCSERSG